MRIYLHLGYPLTATTLLSHELFSKHTEINYLGVELSRYNEIVKYKKNNQILINHFNFYYNCFQISSLMKLKLTLYNADNF